MWCQIVKQLNPFCLSGAANKLVLWAIGIISNTFIHSFIRLWNVCISMEDWSCQNQKKNNVTKYTKHKCYHFTRLFSLTLTQHVQDNAYCLRNKLFSAYCRISRWQMRLKRCSKLHEKHIYICCNIPQEEKVNDSSTEVTSFYCLVQKLDVSFVNECSGLIKTSTDCADSMAVADRGSVLLITEGKRLNAKATEGSAWVGEMWDIRLSDALWTTVDFVFLKPAFLFTTFLFFFVPLCSTVVLEARETRLFLSAPTRRALDATII